MRSPQGPVASFCGDLVSCTLFPETWALTRAGLLSRQPPICSPRYHLCVLPIQFLTWSHVSILVYWPSCKYFSHFTDFMSFSPSPLFHFFQFGSFPHFMTSLQILPSPWNHPWLSNSELFPKDTQNCSIHLDFSSSCLLQQLVSWLLDKY